MKRFNAKPNGQKGYILLMAILISSIILAISFGIYALTIKEIILASFLKDSAKALGAADRAMECTLYWDRSSPQDGFSYTIFTTSTPDYTFQPNAIATAFCDTTDIRDVAQTGWTAVNGTADTGLTTFTLNYPDNTCSEVSVFKESNATTTIVANGYNICGPTNVNIPRRTQRTIQVQGNF